MAPRAAQADARPRVHAWLCTAVAVLLALGFVLPPQHVLGQDTTPVGRSVIVTSAADAGPGTLRQALTDAQAGDVITFDPVVFPPSVPVTIPLRSGLPTIIANAMTIDASNAGVILDGNGASDTSGLHIEGADSVTIRGLQVLNFRGYGIELNKAARNAVIGGSRTTGAAPLGQGNLISGNWEDGVVIQDPGTSANRVMGNIIGADLTGTRVMANGQNGVIITVGASDNVVGGTAPGEGNLISGNGQAGVLIQTSGTSANRVLGNIIGADATGGAALSNLGHGIMVADADHNVIGEAGAGNLISGNVQAGIWIQETDAKYNQVAGNIIGANAAGTDSLPNGGDGIHIGGASWNAVGGTAYGAANLISGNKGRGIYIQQAGATHNAVVGNLIGVDATGQVALGNRQDGIFIHEGSADNVIGGQTPAERNVISGNGGNGLALESPGTSGNQVLGNYIGTDVAGSHAVPNTLAGVYLHGGANENTIGTDAAGNLISGNRREGILLLGTDFIVTDNRIAGNRIGSDAVRRHAGAEQRRHQAG